MKSFEYISRTLYNLNAREYNTSVAAYSGNLYRFILKMTKDADMANDIVQEAYMKRWEHLAEVVEPAKNTVFSRTASAFCRIKEKLPVYAIQVMIVS